MVVECHYLCIFFGVARYELRTAVKSDRMEVDGTEEREVK